MDKPQVSEKDKEIIDKAVEQFADILVASIDEQVKNLKDRQDRNV